MEKQTIQPDLRSFSGPSHHHPSPHARARTMTKPGEPSYEHLLCPPLECRLSSCVPRCPRDFKLSVRAGALIPQTSAPHGSQQHFQVGGEQGRRFQRDQGRSKIVPRKREPETETLEVTVSHRGKPQPSEASVPAHGELCSPLTHEAQSPRKQSGFCLRLWSVSQRWNWTLISTLFAVVLLFLQIFPLGPDSHFLSFNVPQVIGPLASRTCRSPGGTARRRTRALNGTRCACLRAHGRKREFELG